jgi:hypothetical protein
MSIVRIEEDIQPLKYLVITQATDPESVITTNVVISDTRLSRVNLISIEKGAQGDTGLTGPQGPPGKDGIVFDKLPINSGGTNNTTFNSGNIIYFDGSKLSSSPYSVDSLLNAINSSAAITGVINGSGLYKSATGNTVTLGANIGDGLSINGTNQIVVDDTIVRKVELSLGNIDGIVPIAKGGTNNQVFTSNKLLYYDGSKISSFPLNTGSIVLSGTKIDIIAGSGLTGGGLVNLPSGSVVLNIGSSNDILVENTSISLSTTGTPGTYSKITTDSKGRVISGSSLSSSDILSILGYTPWHPGNDGSGSGLDADLLDGLHASAFFDLGNQTGTLNPNSLPIQTTAGTFTKVTVNNKGIVVNGIDNNYFDIVNALGYRPVSTTGDTINGSLQVNGNINLNADELLIKDNLPTIGTNSSIILPSEPRGFSFLYGGATLRTGILAYYPSNKELRLITDITSDTGNINGGSSSNAFRDDIDGGNADSVYLMGNITGDTSVVLLRSVGDSSYVSRINDQIVSGIKTFAKRITVNEYISILPSFGQTAPPLYVGSNTGLVYNFNSDLLDGNHGIYYTDASNMTGLFSYNKVEFDNLDGTADYIPRFDSRTADPSRTISNSIIRQKADTTAIIIDNDANLYVGNSNSGSFLSNNSIAAGSNNKIYQDSSLAIGSNNIVSGDNSIALNYGSKTLKDKSIAAGNYGYTWASNQFSFGAFSETDSNNTIAQGQYSTIALGLPGSQTNGNWVAMTPNISIPKNKTIAYNIEVLLNKAAGTGAALFVFNSGLVKNMTYRDPNDITILRNTTRVLRSPNKQEIYNDSQYRRHYYHYLLDLDETNTIQNLDVSRTPLPTNTLAPQNTEVLYKYTPEYLTLGGAYEKTNDGKVIVTLNKPYSDGWFYQNSSDTKIFVKSYNHGLVSGCLVDLNMVSGYIYRPLSKKYKAIDIIDKHNFTVSEHSWNGYMVNNSLFVLDPNKIQETEELNSIKISGNIYTNGNTLTNPFTSPIGSLASGMFISFGPDQDKYPASLIQTGIITSVTNDTITFSPSFTGTYLGSSIYNIGFCKLDKYSRYVFDTTKTFQFNLGTYGYQNISNISGVIDTTYCGVPTIGIFVSGLTSNFSGTPVIATPASTNSGTLTLIPKRNYQARYNRSASTFNVYEGIYTQYQASNGTSRITVFNKELGPIDLPSAPFTYSLVCGEGSNDNSSFSIQNDKLVSAQSFDYETKSSYKIRVRSTDRSDRITEKPLIITIGDITGAAIQDDNDHLNSSNYSFNLTNILLSNNTIAENLPIGTTIGTLSTIGGYSPYLEFSTASNSFNGVLVSGSNVISECGSYSQAYPTTTLYGDPYALVTGLAISTSHTGLPYATISGVVAPVSISGFTQYSGYIISGCSPSPIGSMFSGMKLYSSLSGWNPESRVVSLTSNSITLNLPFTGTQTIPVGISVNTLGRSFVLNNTFVGSGIVSAMVTYSGAKPHNDNYYPSGLQIFSSTVTSGRCPTTVSQYHTYGFSTETNEYTASPGYYLTGIVYFYTNVGKSEISLSLPENPYLENNEHSTFLNFINSSYGSVPLDDTYTNISGLNNNNFLVHNTHLYPEIALDSTGVVLVNLDRNHGFKILDSSNINQIPIQFSNPILSNTNRAPKNNLFDIIDITGNKIIVKDSQNYLLSEINSPKYFEQPIRAEYRTNGFNFNGTVFHNSNRIFNIDKNNITSFLKRNSIISNGSPYYIDYKLPISIDRIDDGFILDVTATPGSKILRYCGSSLWNIQLFSGVNLYSNNSLVNGVTIANHTVNTHTLESIALDQNTIESPALTYTFATSSTPGTGIDYTKNYIVRGCSAGSIGLSGYCYFYTVSGIGGYPQTYTFAPAYVGGPSRSASETLSISPSQATIKLINGTSSNTTILFNTSSILHANLINPADAQASGSPFPYALSTDHTRPYSLAMKIPITLNSSTYPRDILEIRATSGCITHIVPSLNSSNEIVYTTERYPVYCYFDLYNIATTGITPDNSLILDSTIPNYGENATKTYAITTSGLPKIFTKDIACLNSYYGLKHSNNYFYNGDTIYIDNLSTPRSYLNIGDQLTILQYNNNPAFGSGVSKSIRVTHSNSRNTAFSGININGNDSIILDNLSFPKKYGFTNPLGLTLTDTLPTTGTLSFIGSVSGYCNIPFSNNIYYHTYGGSTASWPMDPSGEVVPNPVTGIYSIGVNSTNCMSGTLCIKITPFSNAVFNNIPDAIDRNDLGSIPNFIETNNVSGYIKPLGINKKLYFDFSDDCSEINGSYYVVDKIDSNTFTINIPYNENYFSRSGLVYLIDSDFNIKSNRSPNRDNSFVTSSAQVSIANNLVDSYINSYNNGSKRWKHLVHFNKNINTFGGYNVTFNGINQSQLISLPPDTIKIFQIEYSLDNGSSYSTIGENETLTLPSNKLTIYLRFTLSDGAGKWSNDLTLTAPRINIYGVGTYNIDSANMTYNTTTKKWSIVAIIENINQIVDHKDITLTATDETGSVSTHIFLTSKVIPEIKFPIPVYAYQNSSEWVLPYDIKKLPSTPITITASGYPGSSSYLYNETLDNSENVKILAGPAGSVTGVFHPTITIRDFATSEVLSSQSGIITVLPLTASVPYSIQPQNLDDDIYLNITTGNSQSFVFYVPSDTNTGDTNLVVTFAQNSHYTITPVIEYSTSSKRYRVKATVNGTAGYYGSQNITINISQPTYGSDGSTTWTRYSYNKAVNFTLYTNLQINKTQLIEPLTFDIEEPWAIQFKVDNGIGAFRPDKPPRVRLSNLPTIGSYDTQPLEYLFISSYDDIEKKWNFIAFAKKDSFGRYRKTTGEYLVKIYAEDDYSTNYETVRLLFTRSPYLDNIKNIIYSTPNNPYLSLIDVKEPTSETSAPSVSIPGELKESTINLTKWYNKYDSNLKLWEYAYSGSPITDKWDVDLSISNLNTSLGDSTTSSISLNCKGISTDKLYGIAKLNLIELDSNTISSLSSAMEPLQIINVVDPYYRATEGSAWSITFSTSGGLSNPNYPPTIRFSGLPSPCTGYDPKFATELQNSCFSSKKWDNFNKKWDFGFVGIPLCNISGLKSFSITAIDTDTTQNIYLDSDIAYASILYSTLDSIGATHPAPEIVEAPLQQAQNPIQLYPKCGDVAIDRYYNFGIKNRGACPIPTGITGWIVSGSLPSGLNYSISFPGGSPSAPWNNLSSGTLRVYGVPQTFASGGLYSEKFTFTVYDARNKSDSKQLTFTDISTANPASPLNIIVYFENEKPAYTPKSNNIGGIEQPSGSKALDGGSISTYWPPSDPISLTCTSILPHSNCQTSTFSYSGGGNSRVYITNTRIDISSSSDVYFEFDNNPSNSLNKGYKVQTIGGSGYITIPGNILTTGTGRLVKSSQVSYGTSNLQPFNGTVDTNTANGIMGCGSFKPINFGNTVSTSYGLYGRIKPSFVANIPLSGVFNTNDSLFTGLVITSIPQYSADPSVFTVKTSNCWETGYIRLSGMQIPKPSIELPAPPPSFDVAPFAYNNQPYAVLSRCSYGNSAYERDLAANYRSISINYLISNAVSGIAIASGTVPSIAAGTTNGTPIQFNNILNSGTVFSIFLNNTPEKFPTYKYNAIPYLENEYFWVHKGGNRDDNPTQTSFPPIIMTGIRNNISCLSGVPISGYSIRAIGGYIPYSGGSQKVPFYQLPNNTVWRSYDYAPSFTGILQKKLNDKVLIGTYQHSGFLGGVNGQKINISLPAGFDSNNYVLLTFSGDLSFSTGIVLSNTYANTISLPFERQGLSVSGLVIASDKCVIQSVNNGTVTINHNNLTYSVGDYIDILDGSSASTENNSILPSNYKLSIVGGNSTTLTASFSGPSNYPFMSGLFVSGFYDLRKNYYDQIQIRNIAYSNKEGEWRFSLSGTPIGLYKDYIYKMISLENPNLPAFSGTSLTPKKYTVEYPLFINKPIQIILPNPNISKNNGAWSLSFEIEGGLRPVYSNTPEILINGNMCNFTRKLNIQDMTDNYNSSTDRLSITLSGINSIGYDWRNTSNFSLKVYDDTGFDTQTVNLTSP